MHFAVLTLFPQMIEQAASHSIFGRGISQGLLRLNCINIRDFSSNKHNQVDDYPYGGGAGMVMKAQPIFDAYQHARTLAPALKGSRVVFLTPAGKPLTQEMAAKFAGDDALVLLCGHYEGVDERVVEEIVTDEVSIGDYILTGGELAALVLMDCIARLRPNVLGHNASAIEESFSQNQGGTSLLEYPQYTRPATILSRDVPEILLSGNHQAIATWRQQQAFLRTEKRRPDLLK